MTDRSHPPGWDAQAIARIAKERFGSYKEMFAYHGWELGQGQHVMHQAAPRIVETYGSVAAFVDRFDGERRG